jgi:hypothetical protein
MIDTYLILCLSLPVLMLALAIVFDARRRWRRRQFERNA